MQTVPSGPLQIILAYAIAEDEHRCKICRRLVFTALRGKTAQSIRNVNKRWRNVVIQLLIGSLTPDTHTNIWCCHPFKCLEYEGRRIQAGLSQICQGVIWRGRWSFIRVDGVVRLAEQLESDSESSE